MDFGWRVDMMACVVGFVIFVGVAVFWVGLGCGNFCSLHWNIGVWEVI